MRQSKSKKHAKKKADRYFSKYIRKKHADYRGLVQCVTCGKYNHWKKMHCGHFMSRRYENTRYDEKNCAPQCPACNTFNQGRQYRFAQWIDRTYGDGTAEMLEQKSKIRSKRRKQYDYEFLAKHYKEKAEKLESIPTN